jgi:hypothetical protein
MKWDEVDRLVHGSVLMVLKPPSWRSFKGGEEDEGD